MRLSSLPKPSASVPGVAVNTQHPPIFEHSLLQESKEETMQKSRRGRAGLSRQEQAMLASWCAAPTSADPGP